MALTVTCSCGRQVSMNIKMSQPAKCPGCGAAVSVPGEKAETNQPAGSAEHGEVYRLLDAGPSPAPAPALDGILPTHCGWCQKPLESGNVKCRACGWTPQVKKKGPAKATVIALAELEMRRESAAHAPPDPPSWLRILLGPFNLLRVLIPALGISLELIVFGLFFGGIGALCIWAGQPGMVVLVMLFATCLLFGHLVRRMFEVASWAAAKRKWKASLFSDLVTLVYAILVLVIGFAPFVFLVRMSWPELRSGLLSREMPRVELPFVIGLIASLLWAVYYVPMAFTATGAMYRYTLMPWTVGRWIWKCWPHMTLCLLLLPVYSAITCTAVVVGVGWSAMAIDPSLHEEATRALEWCEQHLEKIREDPEHIRQVNAEIAEELRQRRAAFDIDDPHLQRTLTYLVLAVWLAYFVVLYPSVALYHMLGLIVCRREASIGWWEQRAEAE